MILHQTPTRPPPAQTHTNGNTQLQIMVRSTFSRQSQRIHLPVLVRGQGLGARPPTRRRRGWAEKKEKIKRKKKLGRSVVAPSRAAQLPSRRARSCRFLPYASKTHRWCRQNALGGVSLFSGAVVTVTPPPTVTSAKIDVCCLSRRPFAGKKLHLMQ